MIDHATANTYPIVIPHFASVLLVYMFSIVSDVTNHLRCNQRLSKRCVVAKCDLLVGAFPTSKIRRIDHMPDVLYRCVCCDRQEVGAMGGWLVSRVPVADMI